MKKEPDIMKMVILKKAILLALLYSSLSFILLLLSNTYLFNRNEPVIYMVFQCLLGGLLFGIIIYFVLSRKIRKIDNPDNKNLRDYSS